MFMQQEALDLEARERLNREAALTEVLSSYVEPRAVSYRFVAAFVLAGLTLCGSIAWAASRALTDLPVRFEAAAEGGFERGVTAFNRGDWDEAERLLRQAASQSPHISARVADYADRLQLIRRDGERLARAEEALAVGVPEAALEQVQLIGANSPLFPQAEVLSRAARAQAEAALLAKQAAKLEAEAERQASRAAVARTFAPAPEAPPRQAMRRRARSGVQGTQRGDEAW
jgi:tetratricopeptide (TPR) repeat protein